ncbi:MAG: hypothetical protein M4579_001078 [Chaenotheca gracillima]|nr:MAG: hypothetical protein M4579_001078 [Chaenotheca gracillima]
MDLPAGGGYVDPNFPNPQKPQDARIIIYGYTPSFALCITAIVVFTLSFVAHLVQVIKYRTWYFVPLSVACVMEIVGYVLRSLSAKSDPYNLPYFIVQYFFIIVAPVLISASIYVCLTKLIEWAHHEGFKTDRLKPKLILWGFIGADVVTTIAQVAGAALIGSAESNRKSPDVPNDIVLAGLAFQTFAFTIFLVVFVVLSVQVRSAFRSIGVFVVALLVSSLLVYLRTIFRLAETSQGVFGYLMVHEALFAALEFVPIVVAVCILAIFHPGRMLGRN